MKSKEETALIETVMEGAFDKMYSPSIVNELCSPDITDWQRGKIAGQIEMMVYFASQFNPMKVEDAKDEDGLAGQTLG